MSEADRPQIMRILGYWDMAPRACSLELPEPERSDIETANTFVATTQEITVGVASYILRGDRFAETASLAVDPAWLGVHIGERLQIARLAEMKVRGIERIQTEADRPAVIEWYIRKFGYQIVGTARKKHEFGLASIDYWTVLELNLLAWHSPDQN